MSFEETTKRSAKDCLKSKATLKLIPGQTRKIFASIRFTATPKKYVLISAVYLHLDLLIRVTWPQKNLSLHLLISYVHAVVNDLFQYFRKDGDRWTFTNKLKPGQTKPSV